MRFLRAHTAILLLLCCPFMIAENVEHTNVLKAKLGGVYQLDTYLSPLAFTGMQIGLGNEWWQPFRQDTSWAHVGRVDGFAFRTVSSARSNQIKGFDISGGWGAFYAWKWCDNRLRLFLGPYLEGGLTVREISSNVNKPVSVDLALDLMAMSGIAWSFYGKKTSYRLLYQIRTNLIGVDCLPDYWQSYYEMSSNTKGLARCSGHWNHHTVKQDLSLDMQFPHTTWRVGVEHQYIRYGTSDLYFNRHHINLVLGCIWNYRLQTNKRL